MRRPIRQLAAVALAAALACLPGPARADGDEATPEWAGNFEHRDIYRDPGFRFDRGLQGRLEATLDRLALRGLVEQGRLGVALVDLADPARPVLAEVRGGEMIYAASVPKIAVLYAAFQARKERRLAIDADMRETLTDMCRVSSNCAASQAIHAVGFPYIASVMYHSGLYDPEMGGGLWVGKAYGGPDDYWIRDPVANLSHGATAVSVARLLTLLSQGRLVDAASSREMLEMLGDPGIHHKFVKGLDARPSTICRKSGSWRDWHGDAALIERDGKRYVAVALLQDARGESILQSLILGLDDCIEDHPVPRQLAALPAPLPPTRDARGY